MQEKVERGFGTCEVEWTGKVETKKFLAEGGACMVIPGFKWRTFDNSGSSTEGTLIYLHPQYPTAGF